MGSSMMLKINLLAVLKELGVTGAEVEHCDLNSIRGANADLVVAAQDLAAACQGQVPVVALTSIMNKAEIRQKLGDFLARRSTSSGGC
jgi:galactitol-specific phosphotransferase system IIB component